MDVVINYSKARPSTEIISELLKNSDLFKLPDGLHPRIHSKILDKLFGFKIKKIEQKLLQQYRAYDQRFDDSNRKQKYQGTQTWIGLHPQVLQTPYSEIHHFLSFLQQYNPKKIIDFGAGYGRVGLVLSALMPEAQFVGYEILEERLFEAERIFKQYSIDNSSMVKEDLLCDEFVIPKADIYFIYDFSDPLDVRKFLKKLSQNWSSESFFIVAKGEGIRSLIQNKFPEFWAANGVLHSKEWSIYSSFQDLEGLTL